MGTITRGGVGTIIEGGVGTERGTLIVTGLGLGIAKKLERGLHFEVWAHLPLETWIAQALSKVKIFTHNHCVSITRCGLLGASIDAKRIVEDIQDTSSISQSQSLSYGNTIVSRPLGTFELGFFNLGNPNKIYLGIWYKNIPIQNVVWIANGANPINESSAILKLNSSGNLVISHNNIDVWYTSSANDAQNPVAVLLDSELDHGMDCASVAGQI
ncbi:hypothetical protein DEO72_LG3g948 [Vigna unguiculata]|uniref:Bulb-type lectin domain-containing protein n=1 Tax=Vigna unguiculata TaxID=3917 RepID=A0A4D6LDE8_VIGUN|nr:hypothetical protein DEO72_LG3g948 [Vigna unguiculata]